MTTHPATALLRRALRSTGSLAPVSRFSALTMHRLDVPVYRLTGGRATLASLLSGLPVVLLTTTGARSGQPRTWPLVGLPDGDRVVVLASNYGAPRHPAWYHNLRSNPRAILHANGVSVAVEAVEVDGDERDRLWRLGLEYYPAWAQYERWAAPRRIPVIVLTPLAAR